MPDAPSDEHRRWIASVLGVEIAAPVPDGLDAASTAWRTARTKAVDQLRRLNDAITAAKDPEADAARILLLAIIKNLTAEPATSNAVSELERYLTTDDIIAEAEGPNGFGIAVQLRAPLLAALAGLKANLTT